MNFALITVGNELLNGFTVNTNASWIGNNILKHGGKIIWHQTMGDTKDEILHALKQVPMQAEGVIITGGLGPTHDDVTANALYEYVGDQPVFDESYWNDLKSFFAKRNIKIPELNRNQAFRPEKGKIIPNPLGSARGLHFNHEAKHIFVLPGVPKEMKAMMDQYVFPWIANKSKDQQVVRTIRTTGIAESTLAEKLKELTDDLKNQFSVAFLPQFTGVDIRLTGHDQEIIDRAIRSIYNIAKPYVYAFENENLEEVIGRLLIEKNQTLATAESCTGGLVGHRLTNISSCSRYYAGGIISYSNEVKAKQLGVAELTLSKFGAVSRETATAMAENIRQKFNTDFGLAITGIAGPAGGTEQKPVGLTYIALATDKETVVKEFRFFTDREYNKTASSQAAMNMLRIYISNA